MVSLNKQGHHSSWTLCELPPPKHKRALIEKYTTFFKTMI